MMNRKKIACCFAFIAFVFCISSVSVFAKGNQDDFNEIYKGGTSIETTGSNACNLLTDEERDKNPACATYDKDAFDIAQGIINTTSATVGVVAVIIIIIAGIMMSTSFGDSGKVRKAKSAILYSVIGLVVAVLAAAIVNFVLDGIM